MREEGGDGEGVNLVDFYHTTVFLEQQSPTTTESVEQQRRGMP